ncbi:MAG: extracellular solute-binding protein [Holosporales bacterium]|jgi:putrescine transport system substrate-binding protein|nr:extracellular solute-binding protein [Holosporales bacterium]
MISSSRRVFFKRWGKISAFGVILGSFVFWSLHRPSPIPSPSRYGVSLEELTPFDEESSLHLYGWVGFLPPEILEDFEKLTGIRVEFDVFDTNELLEAKLFAGQSGYDIVFPTAFPYFARQLQGDIYQPLDKERLRAVWHLDATIMRRLETIDPDHQYAIPYQWGVMGIGIRAQKVKKVLGHIPHSWRLVFDPLCVAKLQESRIELCEAPGELIPAVLAFLGRNPESDTLEDLEVAASALRRVRPYITKFNPSGYESLASGTATVVIGTSGDILRARRQAVQEGWGKDIAFVFPREGAALWMDVMAIPKGAPHPNNAHAFIAYLLHPRVMAALTTFTLCANAVPTSQRYLDPEIKRNVLIYPPANMRKKCYLERHMPAAYEAARTRLLTQIKAEF